jgi:HSP20 family molecular chaperone IbpA
MSFTAVEAKCVHCSGGDHELREILKKEESDMRVETDSMRFLAPESPAINPGDAFYELSEEIRNLISIRAYELFELRGSVHGHDCEDWQQAVSDILVDVPVDVVTTEAGFTIRAAVHGFSERDLEVRVAPRSLCISGKRQEVSERKAEAAVQAEQRSNQIFRAVELPSEIDPASVRATVSDGILEIKLTKVGLGKRIPILANAASA